MDQAGEDPPLLLEAGHQLAALAAGADQLERHLLAEGAVAPVRPARPRPCRRGPARAAGCSCRCAARAAGCRFEGLLVGRQAGGGGADRGLERGAGRRVVAQQGFDLGAQLVVLAGQAWRRASAAGNSTTSAKSSSTRAPILLAARPSSLPGSSGKTLQKIGRVRDQVGQTGPVC